MSKKNNKATKVRYHELSLQRERDAALKKQQKAAKKTQRELAKKVAPSSKVISKKRPGAIRICKGAVVKGIKITDAASKKRARQLLNAGKAVDMETDLPKEKPRKLSKKLKKAKKAAKPAVDAAVPMD